MKGLFIVLLITAVASLAFYGCAAYEYGSYYYFPDYPYEYTDPYGNYYLYNYYYYGYPYVYRLPPAPYYFDERNRQFRHEEPEVGGDGGEEIPRQK